MKISKFFMLLAITAFSTAFITILFYNLFMIEKIITLDMSVSVKDKGNVCINADPNTLAFGGLSLGTEGRRLVFLDNNAPYPLKVSILKSGYIASWVTPSANNFLLEQNEQRNITFKAVVPYNHPTGDYTGKVDIIFKKTLI